MKARTSFVIICAVCIVLQSSCNKEKLVDIVLPDYVPQLVVECYIEPGKPYQLLLTEGVSYFDVPSIPPVADALVTITFKGKTDTLKFDAYNLRAADSLKVYNFKAAHIVPAIYNEIFTLNIKDSKGRYVNATTMLLPPPTIDTIQYVFEGSDTSGIMLTKLQLTDSQNNYYRYVLVKTRKNVQRLVQETYFDSKLAFNNPNLIKTGNHIIIKSRKDFVRNPLQEDLHDLYVYRIEAAFYNFLKSADDARNANGNPFAQPSGIKSNVSGGVGIFTAVSPTKRMLSTPD